MHSETAPVKSEDRDSVAAKDASNLRELIQEQWSITLCDEVAVREFSRSLSTLPD